MGVAAQEQVLVTGAMEVQLACRSVRNPGTRLRSPSGKVMPCSRAETFQPAPPRCPQYIPGNTTGQPLSTLQIPDTLRLFNFYFHLMPTTTAAAKALRQNIKARARNKGIKDGLKKLQVRLRKATTAQDKGAMATIVKEYTRALDKAAQKKVVTRNMAARKKSRLSALLKRG